MVKWRVRIACEVAGTWRETGEIVEMSVEEARFLAAPFGNVLLPADHVEKGAVDDGLKRRKRQHVKRSQGLGARPAIDRQNSHDTDR